MKKAISVLLSVFLILTVMTVFCYAADSTAQYANTKPVIDGTIDDVWSTTAAQESTFLGDNDGEGISGYTKLLWDDDYLYVLAVVQDATMLQAASPSTTDSIDVWVSETNSSSDGYPEAGDYIFSISPYNTLGSYYIGSEAALSAVEFTAVMVGDTSYVIEARMPWQTPGFAPAAGTVIGYNVSFNNDLDGDNARDSWVSWQDYNDRYYWSNTSALNTVELTGEKVVETKPVTEAETAPEAAVTETPAAAQTFDIALVSVIAALSSFAGIVIGKKRV